MQMLQQLQQHENRCGIKKKENIEPPGTSKSFINELTMGGESK